MSNQTSLCPFKLANSNNYFYSNCNEEKCAWFISITTPTEVKKMCAITAIANNILSGGNFKLD